jgi:AraC family transcriptional regulator
LNHSQDQFYIKGINRVQDYIENHLDEPLNVKDLSKIAAFSEFHFHRIYSSFTGESLYSFIKRIRLEKASYMLLSDSERSITDIALSLGFENQSSFAKAFKDKFEISAREYRIQNISTRPVDFFKTIGVNPTRDIEPRAIQIRMEQKQSLIYLRYTGAYKENSDLFSRLFQHLYNWALERDLVSNQSRWFVIYHDFGNETNEEMLRLSVCMTVHQNVAVDGEIGFMVLEEGKYGVGGFWVTAKEYGKAWYYMYAKWLPQSGYKPADRFALEHYPPVEPQGEKRFVEIYIPLF